jgi:hypothetical protein
MVWRSPTDLNRPSDLLRLALFEHAGIVIFWFIDPLGGTRLVNPIWRVELDLRRVEGARE